MQHNVLSSGRDGSTNESICSVPMWSEQYQKGDDRHGGERMTTTGDGGTKAGKHTDSAKGGEPSGKGDEMQDTGISNGVPLWYGFTQLCTKEIILQENGLSKPRGMQGNKENSSAKN